MCTPQRAMLRRDLGDLHEISWIIKAAKLGSVDHHADTFIFTFIRFPNLCQIYTFASHLSYAILRLALNMCHMYGKSENKQRK